MHSHTEHLTVSNRTLNDYETVTRAGEEEEERRRRRGGGAS
jgi:hypothetical protein